jgi:hypothetical protein
MAQINLRHERSAKKIDCTVTTFIIYKLLMRSVNILALLLFLHYSEPHQIQMREELLIHCAELLNCQKSLFNKTIDSCPDRIEKEKINIFKQYYSFLHCDFSLAILFKIINILKENLKIDATDCTVLSIILFKSFTNKTSTTKMYETYTSSDEIFNYMVEQYGFYFINKNTTISSKKISTFCLHAIHLVVLNNVVLEKTISMSSKNSLKTFKYYHLVDSGYIEPLEPIIFFSYDIFKVIKSANKYYVTTHHYSKTVELFKTNFKSNRAFKLTDIDYILKKINIELYVDDDYQRLLKKTININKKDLIKKIKLNSFQINSLFANLTWTSKTKDKISTIQAQNSKYFDLLLYDFFSDYDFKDTPIFIPIFFDFRGRQYYYSKIGPTSSKIIRLAFFYGWVDQRDLLKNSGNFSLKYGSAISFFCKKHGLLDNKNYYEYYLWILIGIGKFYIDKKTYPIPVEAFIDAASQNFDSSVLSDVGDILEVAHYRNILLDISKTKVKKRAIIKDATASVNQILMKKLGPLNRDSINYVNLGEVSEWYDTYLVCKDLFYKFVKNEPTIGDYHKRYLFDEVFPRKLIKNPIMVIPYGAGNKLCWENYQKAVIEGNLTIKKSKLLKTLFKAFCEFIREDVQSRFLFQKKSSSMVEELSMQFEASRKCVLKSKTGEADISYYKMKKASVDKKYRFNSENKRITKLLLIPSEALDKRSFDLAAGANVVHFYDADELREIENDLGYSMITIHDSYLVEFTQCSKLIETKMAHYQKNIDTISPGYKIQNIFILL